MSIRNSSVTHKNIFTTISPDNKKNSLLSHIPPAFKYSDFRILWTGAFISSTGTWMQIVAQNWLVFTLTNSAFWLGLDGFLSLAPSLAFSLIGGAIADRFDRRRILLISQFSQMTCAFILATLTYLNIVQVWHILILSFLTGTAQAFGAPAYLSLLPNLVDSKDIPNAVALNSIQFNMARMLGPAFAGLAYAKFGASICFALNGLSFVAVEISLLKLKFQPVQKKITQSIIADLKQGFNFLINHTMVWQLSILGFLSTFLAISLPTLLPVFAKQVFHSSVGLYTYFVFWSGAGAVVGGILIAVFSFVSKRGLLTLWAQIIFGICAIGFAFSSNLQASYGLLFISGICMVTIFSMIAMLIQISLSDEVRGRIVSIYMFMFQGGMSFGGLVAGTTALYLQPFTALIIENIIFILIGITLLATRSRISKL